MCDQDFQRLNGSIINCNQSYGRIFEVLSTRLEKLKMHSQYKEIFELTFKMKDYRNVQPKRWESVLKLIVIEEKLLTTSLPIMLQNFKLSSLCSEILMLDVVEINNTKNEHNQYYMALFESLILFIEILSKNSCKIDYFKPRVILT